MVQGVFTSLKDSVYHFSQLLLTITGMLNLISIPVFYHLLIH